MFCDYFLVRRTQLQSDALYQEQGIYGGFRWQAVLVLVLAVLPNLPGFYNAATDTKTFPLFFDQIYNYAWFLGITIAFVLYALLQLGKKQHAPAPTL